MRSRHWNPLQEGLNGLGAKFRSNLALKRQLFLRSFHDILIQRAQSTPSVKLRGNGDFMNSSNTSSIGVVVCDRNSVDAELLGIYLRQLGCDVDTTVRGEVAVAMAAAPLDSMVESCSPTISFKTFLVS